MLTPLVLAPLLAFLPGIHTPEGPDILWQPTLDAAFDAAQEGQTIVFLAVNMDGESANDEAAKRLYHDKDFLPVASQVVSVVASRFEHGGSTCKRFGTITCADHQDVDKKARANILKPGLDGEVIAPQHVWLAADRTVLLSVPYQVSKRELIWCTVTALNKAYPDKQVPMPQGARAPRRLVMDGVTDSGSTDGIRPLSEAEVEETVKQLRSGADWSERARLVTSLIATDHPDAVEAVTKELLGANVRGGGGRGRGADELLGRLNDAKKALLGRIGVYSPPAYWEAVATQMDSEDPEVRMAAAVALEQLGAQDSLKIIKERLRKEESLDIQAALYRAQGTGGAGESSARSSLMSVVKKKKAEQVLKINAYFALGNHASDKAVAKQMNVVVSEGHPLERQAMILGLAFARNDAAAESLFSGLGDQQDKLAPNTRKALELAQQVFEGGNLSLLAELIEEVCGDTVRRERFFGAAQG